jgi:hypothetical protein
MDHLILNPEWFSPKYSTDFNLVSSTSMGHLYLIFCLIQSGLSAWASERCADVFGTAQWRRANSFPTECKFQQDGTRRKSSCQITARWILHLAHFGPHFAWFRHISMGYSWYNIAYIYFSPVSYLRILAKARSFCNCRSSFGRCRPSAPQSSSRLAMKGRTCEENKMATSW